MSNYPSIPTPLPDLAALYATVSALKQVVDLITGAAKGGSPVMRIYISAGVPTGAIAGDAWLRASDRTLLIYNAAGGNWVETL